MKFITFFFILISAALINVGCTTDSETGEVKLFGIVPAETVVETAESVSNEAKGSGGILGIVGTIAASCFALWRRKKELAEKSNAEKAKAVALSVIDGVDAIIAKVNEAKADGGSWTPTKEELLDLLKAAQNSAGTRSDVDNLLAEKATQ
jgi:hypothetical protein